MRIAAGRHKGRKLAAPKGRNTRPTADRVRASIFDILHHAAWEQGGNDFFIMNSTVLDVFAGTGALGLEALSRGAEHAVFIERDRAALEACRGNVESLNESGSAEIMRMDAAKLSARPEAIAPRGLVFLDPPYGSGLGEKALARLADGGWLAPGAICVLEEGAQQPETLPGGYAELQNRAWGDTRARFLQFTG